MDLKRIVAKGLRAVLQPPAFTKSLMDKTARVCSGTQVNYSSIARYSYVGHDGFLLNAEIGPFCSISDNCRIGGAPHAMEYVSTSPVFCQSKNVMNKNFASHAYPEILPVVLEADVWVGAGATIKSGVKIGCGAVVGAGSVVTHDVPPYEIWAGNPARKIRDRFDGEISEKLLETKWWTWDEEKISEFAPYFSDPVAFLKALEEKK